MTGLLIRRVPERAILRMLDSGEIRPVGADRAIRVDVRLVTATQEDPRQAIATAMELTESRIDAALRLHQGRVHPAAAALGISKQVLYRPCERFGIA